MLDAILAGASGYVVKDIEGMELAQAIKDVGAGKSLLDNRAAAALMAKLRGAAERKDPLSGLTDHERTLLGLSMDRSGIRVSRGLVTTGHQPPGRLALGSRGQPQDDSGVQICCERRRWPHQRSAMNTVCEGAECRPAQRIGALSSVLMDRRPLRWPSTGRRPTRRCAMFRSRSSMS